MSETMREAIPIIVMYGFVLLLAPFIGFAMWIAFDGDRMRAEPAVEEQTAPTVKVAAIPERAATTAEQGATSAA